MKRIVFAALLLASACKHGGPPMARITSGQVSLLAPEGWKQVGTLDEGVLQLRSPSSPAVIIVSLNPNENGVNADGLLDIVRDPAGKNEVRTDGKHTGERHLTAETAAGKFAALAVATGTDAPALFVTLTAPPEEFQRLGGMDLLVRIAGSIKSTGDD